MLSVLPRGAGAMGFYDKPAQMVPIKSVRTESASFKAVAEAQRNRGGPWTKVAAGARGFVQCRFPCDSRARDNIGVRHENCHTRCTGARL
ncbi:hypothetical protein GCM10007388_01020 [Pseudoduganella plicata]|uniref:Uncharacterized protein n=1 Tax=Pseudoduganella plicata TaxID=321984 RepID=A0AA87Y334_9BURK|nr:hypothetical protein GCM10007388_01020 [Pseudoduganella plicata]